MATLELRDGATIDAPTVRRLTKAAVELNRTIGDPTSVAKRGRAAGRRR